jgi:hypothetical protein
MSSGGYCLQSSRRRQHDWRHHYLRPGSEKFVDPKNIKYELNGSHTFDSGFILGGLCQYNDRAFSDRASQNLEGDDWIPRTPQSRIRANWQRGGRRTFMIRSS